MSKLNFKKKELKNGIPVIVLELQKDLSRVKPYLKLFQSRCVSDPLEPNLINSIYMLLFRSYKGFDSALHLFDEGLCYDGMCLLRVSRESRELAAYFIVEE